MLRLASPGLARASLWLPVGSAQGTGRAAGVEARALRRRSLGSGHGAPENSAIARGPARGGGRGLIPGSLQECSPMFPA